MVSIDDLSEEKFPPKFTVTSEHLGDLGFRAVYGIDFPYWKARAEPASDEEFVGKLMVRMGWRMEGLEHLTELDRAALTPTDLKAFCQAIVEHEPSVFGRSARKDGEDWLAFVRRAGGAAVQARKGPFEKSASLDMDDALGRNMRAASHMRSILGERPERSLVPPIPRNPTLDTNAILERVEENIGLMARLSEASAALQMTLNDQAVIAIAEMKAGSEQTQRNAKLALWIGLAGVVAGALGTVVAAGTWVWTADQQSKAEIARKADAKVALTERQAARELMQQQLDAMRRSGVLLDERLPPPIKKAGVHQGGGSTRQRRGRSSLSEPGCYRFAGGPLG